MRRTVPVVDVLVPVVHRPWAAAPFMASVAGDPRVRVTAIVQEPDSESLEAWALAGAEQLLQSGTTFAQKVNAGFRTTDAPWMLLAGDDVRFTPGWLDACLRAAESGAQVIGTNEMDGKRVRLGLHSCHPMISRVYVESQGASWDGPGVVCHEGYRHQYVDDEIVLVAKQRHVWAFAEDAVLEHLHPVYGKGPQDAIYRLGASAASADRALFMERRRLNA
jgi:hypothetical protein